MNAKANNYWFEIGLLFALSVMWGSAFSWTKIGVTSVPPMMFVILRLSFAMPVLAAIIVFRGERMPRKLSAWRALLLLGLLQNALPFTLISWGSQYIASSEAGLLNTTTPMFAFLIAFFVMGQRANAGRKLLGVVIGFLGVLAIFWPNLGADGARYTAGYIAILIASASYAMTPFVVSRLTGRSVFVTALGSMISGTMILVPLSLWFEPPLSVRPPLEAWAAIAASGLLASALGTLIWYRLVGTIGPLAVTSGAYLRAGVAVLVGTTLMNEAFTLYTAFGILFILLGVLLVTKR